MTFTPGEEIKIHEHGEVGNRKADVSQFVIHSFGTLERMKAESIEKETEIFKKLEAAVSEWKEQAAETQMLIQAMQYISTPPVKHTSNVWRKNQYGWNELSNMVYKMTWRYTERTINKFRATAPSTVAWVLTWDLYFNVPIPKNDYSRSKKIAGQRDKAFSSQAEMEKYLQGRINAHAHLFAEISPPIPAEHHWRFCINGVLLPGYTVEEPNAPDPEKVSELLDLLDDDLLTEPTEPKQQEPSPEAVWNKNRKQKPAPGKEKRPPAR